MITAYIATVHGGKEHPYGPKAILLGGATEHRSSPFASLVDAQSWAETVIATNRAAGRDASHAVIDQVNLRNGAKVLRAAVPFWHPALQAVHVIRYIGLRFGIILPLEVA